MKPGCHSIRSELLSLFDSSSQSGDLAGSGVFVKNALGSSLVDDRLGILKCCCSCSCIVSFDSKADLLDGGLDTGLDSFVLSCSLLAGENSLLGRFNVCHFISSEIKLFSNKYVFLIPFAAGLPNMSAAYFHQIKFTVQPRKQLPELPEYRQKDTRTSAKTYLYIIQKCSNSVNL